VHVIRVRAVVLLGVLVLAVFVCLARIVVVLDIDGVDGVVVHRLPVVRSTHPCMTVT
jgi:hypothetical protein